MLSFASAALFGLALVALSGAFVMLLVGAASIAAAWYYTGGKRPYGYTGLGEVFVFVFFGLVATLGTTYTQALSVSPASIAGAVGVGAIASAILVANNLRDIPTDQSHGKRTLAVRLGHARTRRLYAALLTVALACVVVAGVIHPTALIALLSFVLAFPLVAAGPGRRAGQRPGPRAVGDGPVRAGLCRTAGARAGRCAPPGLNDPALGFNWHAVYASGARGVVLRLDVFISLVGVTLLSASGSCIDSLRDLGAELCSRPLQNEVRHDCGPQCRKTKQPPALIRVLQTQKP